MQQANSVFAGRTAPTDGAVGDTPSGEDRASNYYGVSHFPCCITNFPQVLVHTRNAHMHVHVHMRHAHMHVPHRRLRRAGPSSPPRR